MRPQDIINQIVQFLQEIIKNENVDKLKLANSFMSSLYTNERYNKVKTSLDLQISDGEFYFAIHIQKDKDGNIIDFVIEKDDI